MGVNADFLDTIAALSSAPGKAGVAVIRVSGSRAFSALSQMIEGKFPAPRVASLKPLKHPSSHTPIDHALILTFPNPASYTGEDVVEFHVHGGVAVVTLLLKALCSLDGIRLAEPGEFSRRAFLNGKMDLTSLEGVSDLIHAETDLQHKIALRQMEGELGKLYETWRLKLIHLLAQIEAYIDFPDEDLPESLEQEILAHAATLLSNIRMQLGNTSHERIRSGIVAVILGAPNAGKSSLMNALAARDVAIVSSLAGTTRDTIEIHLDIAGYPLTLIDTAGLRDSADPIEQEGIRRAKEKAEKADLKLCLFDAATLPDLDATTLSLLGKNALAIISRSDLAHMPLPPYIASLPALPVSTTTGDGISALLSHIESWLGNNIAFSEHPLATNERHRQALIACAEALERFFAGRKEKIAIELSAEELRHAAHSLGRITGIIDLEEILDKIFLSFCIGK